MKKAKKNQKNNKHAQSVGVINALVVREVLWVPAGMPVPVISSMQREVANGVTSDGLITVVQPVARIGPSLYARFRIGKFHVNTAATTPTAEYFV